MNNGARQFTGAEQIILRRCAAGEITLAKAGQRLGVSRQRVSQLLQRAGQNKVSVHARKLARAQTRLVELRPEILDGRWTMARLIEELDLCAKAVARLLVETGIDLAAIRPVPAYHATHHPQVALSAAECRCFERKLVT